MVFWINPIRCFLSLVPDGVAEWRLACGFGAVVLVFLLAFRTLAAGVLPLIEVGALSEPCQLLEVDVFAAVAADD